MPSLSAVVKSASRRGRTFENQHELSCSDLLRGNMLDLIGKNQRAGFQLVIVVRGTCRREFTTPIFPLCTSLITDPGVEAGRKGTAF